MLLVNNITPLKKRMEMSIDRGRGGGATINQEVNYNTKELNRSSYNTAVGIRQEEFQEAAHENHHKHSQIYSSKA